MKTKMQQTSLDAFYEEASKNMPERQLLIYRLLIDRGPMSDVALSEAIGVPINGITGSRNLLMNEGYIQCAGQIVGPTGRQRMLWAPTTTPTS